MSFFSMSEEESGALEFIHSWEPKSDVRAFRYGPTICCASAAASAMYINYRFRRALKLQAFAFATTYAAVVFIPSVVASTGHGIVAVRPLVTGSVRCPVCIETRSALMQAMLGIAYPIILSPLACFQFAERYMTVALPSPRHSPLLLLKKIASIIKPMRRPLLWLALFQMAVGAGLTYWERSNLVTVLQKFSEMEKVVESHVSKETLKQMKEDTVEHVEDKMFLKPEIRPKYSISID